MSLFGTTAKEKKKKSIWNEMKEIQLCTPRMEVNLLSETMK